jgi:hypothetical protein
MATLAGNTIAATYALLLKIDSGGIDGTLRAVEDGDATDSTLKIATDAISIGAGHKLFLDGGGDTYLWQASANLVELFCGGSEVFVANATTTVFNNDGEDRDFRIESDAKTHMFFVEGSTNSIGINNISTPDAVLHVQGETASESVIKVDGSTTNGFIMMADHYVTGEAQYTTGLTHSGAATYLASRCYAATDAVYTDAAGWKSSTDASSYRGSAVVVDGGSGSISLYYGATDSSIAPGSTRTLTRGIYLGEDGDVGIGVTGTSNPGNRLHVLDDVADGYVARFQNDGDNANRHGIVIQCGADDGSTSEETTYINCWDGNGSNIGSIGHQTGGALHLNTTSDSRLKENIADTQLDGLSLCNQIKVREFNWKSDYKGGKKARIGFIAQEVQSVYPEAVSGTDGAMRTEVISKAVTELKDDQGNIIREKADKVTKEYIDAMMIAQDAFIPILMKAVQQLSAKVTALENA